MKQLKHILYESLLDDEDQIMADVEKSIKSSISKFIEENFDRASKCTISEKPNRDGKYVVDCSTPTEIRKRSLTSLTNGHFVWGKVGGDFNCSYCNSLESLEGAPKEVNGDFNCSHCDSLKSLEGAPEKVNRNFYCSYCNSLESLEGAPKEVKRNFDCRCCNSLKSLKGAPKKIGGKFDYSGCESLTSIDYPY